MIDTDTAVAYGLALTTYLEEIVSGKFTYKPNRTLAKHLQRHIWQWFWFLIEPGLEATNWQAEQAMRPGVVNRKVWGGNRTWNGASAQDSVTSVLRTCAQRGREGFHYLTRLLCSIAPIPLPAAKQ
ncbi:MAG: transposase [Planctomycetales bacterium]|nr:transposase [Planctomycetales bacterium]